MSAAENSRVPGPGVLDILQKWVSGPVGDPMCGFWIVRADAEAIVGKIAGLEASVAELEEELADEIGAGSGLSIGDAATLDAQENLN